MQRDDIKKVLSALVPDDVKPDAVEAAVSGLLNLFHGELNTAKKATEEAEQKAAKAAEIAATAAAPVEIVSVVFMPAAAPEA